MGFQLVLFIFLALVSSFGCNGVLSIRLISDFIKNQKQKPTSITIPLKPLIKKPITSLATEDLKSEVIYHQRHMSYYTNMFIGNPRRQFSLFIDTGSSLSWVRCFDCSSEEPKSKCYRKTRFYSEYSTSFAEVTCDSGGCDKYLSTTSEYRGCFKDKCYFGMKYSDDDMVAGRVGFETFTLYEDDSITKASVPRVPFICANVSTAAPYLDGILGLGKSADSFASAVQNSFGFTKFSYCLLDRWNYGEGSSTMVFGDHVVSRDSQVFYVPQVTKFYEHYAVKLNGISIGGVEIGALSPPTFGSKNPSLDIDILVDSGTTFTYLPTTQYNQLLNKMVDFVEGRLGWIRHPITYIGFVCYINGPNIESAPSIVLELDGENARLLLQSHNIWFSFYDEPRNTSPTCLGFKDSSTIDGTIILGNLQQQNIRVIFYSSEYEPHIGFDTSGC